MASMIDAGFIVVGHRGLSGKKTENTIESFKAAAMAGARAVELDVQLSRDGVPVVFHDFSTSRLCSIDKRIIDMSLAGIKELRIAGKWEIPTLTEVFNAIPGTHIFVELKVSFSSSREEKLALCRAVRNAVLKGRSENRVTIISFDPESLLLYGELDRKALLGLDYDSESVGYLENHGQRIQDLLSRFRILLPDHEFHSEENLSDLVRTGKRILPWTVNSHARAAKLKEIGAAGIITDNADEMIDLDTDS